MKKELFPSRGPSNLPEATRPKRLLPASKRLRPRHLPFAAGCLLALWGLAQPASADLLVAYDASNSTGSLPASESLAGNPLVRRPWLVYDPRPFATRSITTERAQTEQTYQIWPAWPETQDESGYPSSIRRDQSNLQLRESIYDPLYPG